MDSQKKYNNITECAADARDGVDGAFDALYNMSFPYAYSAASHLLNSKEDIEDALQNSFYYVSKHISGLRDTNAYLKWLNRIVINECKKILIEENKHTKIFFAEKSRLMMSEKSDDADDKLIEQADFFETVIKIIDEMKPEKSEVLKLFYFENLSYSEISKKLGIPIGTVMSRLHNAKKELEKKVRELQKDGTVLWGLPILPLIAALMSYNVKAEVSSAIIGQVADATSASAASVSGSVATTGTAASATAGAAQISSTVAAVGTSLAVKATAVAVAASVAVCGGTVAKNMVAKHNAKAETTIEESVAIDKTYEEYISNTTQSTVLPSVTRTAPQEKNVSSAVGLISQSTEETGTAQNYPKESKINNTEPTVSTSVSQIQREARTRNLKSSVTQPSYSQTSISLVSSASSLATSTTQRNREVTTEKQSSSGTTKAANSTSTTTRSNTASTTNRSETTTVSGADFSVSGGVLNGYSGSGGNVNIPSTVNGQAVTAIGAGAFEGSNITSVSIPSGVTKIGQTSFSDCTKLTSVSLPSTLTSIGDCAFDGCSSLNSITIPDSVTSIGDDAFDGCDNLTIRCSEGSAAYEYAVENSVDYELI